LTIIASEVVFPEPVAPVRITRPSFKKASRFAKAWGNSAQEQIGTEAVHRPVQRKVEGEIEVLVPLQPREGFGAAQRPEQPVQFLRV
jgi:hypothetical protein